MEGLKLGDIEQAYYNELFQTCDVEGTGRITGMKASELFLASSLPQDALKQILELCGAKRLGHFGRSQFYIALKLIAVAQNNLPLKLETLNAGIEIPLPRFSSKSNDKGDRKRGGVEGDGYSADGKGSSSGSLPPPPSTKQHRRSLSGQYRGVVPDNPASFSSTPQQSLPIDDSPHNSHKSPPPSKTPPTSPIHIPRGLIQRQQTAPATYANPVMAKDTVHDEGHTNSVALVTNNVGGGGGPGGGGGIINTVMAAVAVGNGSSAPASAAVSAFHNSNNENGNWAMFEDEENHILLGGGMKKFEASLEPAGMDSSSISSEAESIDDVYAITDEQREYYIKQFLSMQPDLNKHITGPVAKNFFEKSKLPVTELSKIWNLSDLNRDGALSMEEFCIAMHLVVLRRNDIELPDRLPLSLMPYSTLNDEPFAADLPPGSTLKRATPPSPVENKWKANFVHDSPGSSGVPSPAHLVNFDYAKPSADLDSKIVHPVAVRASPDSHHIPADSFDRDSAVPPSHEMVEDAGGGVGGQLCPRTHPPPSTSPPPPPPSDLPPCDSPGPGSKFSTSMQGPLHGRPRPIPKKPNTVPMVTRGQLQPPPPSSQPGEEGGAAPGATGGGDPAAASVPPMQAPPPTPPPRPQMHGRSMSVDVRAGSSTLPPAVPPRVQPKEAHIFQKASESGATAEPKALPKRYSRPVLTHRRSASLGLLRVSAISSSEPSLVESSGGGSAAGPPPPEHAELGGGEDATDSAGKERTSHITATAHRQMSRDKRDIGMAIRTHKERNAMLTRLNSELNQELQEVMEQRIALEIQLEHLRPFYS